MPLSCGFLQIKEINQKRPQMTFIRLKTRHFRTKKDMWYWYEIAIISRLCCYQMSNHTIWRFTADNFNHNILVAPSFVKRRKLIYAPMYNDCVQLVDCFYVFFVSFRVILSFCLTLVVATGRTLTSDRWCVPSHFRRTHLTNDAILTKPCTHPAHLTRRIT